VTYYQVTELKMVCEQCGKSFPRRKGRFCGTCYPPHTKRMEEAVKEARHVIGCLLTWTEEIPQDELDALKENAPLWDIILKARDWENKYVALESKP